jgi:peptide deformylase
MELVIHPNKVLRQKCIEVNFDEIDKSELEDIGRQMLEIMYNNNGAGLSHPQVAGNSRIFVMGDKDFSRIIINPVIEKKSIVVEADQEGCLSFPDLWMPVKRAKTILAKWNSIDGRIQREFFRDFEARCFQHELDHLDGITFNQRVSKLILSMAMKKQRKKNKHGRQN